MPRFTSRRPDLPGALIQRRAAPSENKVQQDGRLITKTTHTGTAAGNYRFQFASRQCSEQQHRIGSAPRSRTIGRLLLGKEIYQQKSSPTWLEYQQTISIDSSQGGS